MPIVIAFIRSGRSSVATTMPAAGRPSRMVSSFSSLLSRNTLLLTEWDGEPPANSAIALRVISWSSVSSKSSAHLTWRQPHLIVQYQRTDQN
jgi:hypothetical protein